MADESSSKKVREWAERLHQDYTYPVDSILYSFEGRKLGNLPANRLNRSGRDRNASYLQFLKEGLRAAAAPKRWWFW